MQAVILAAGRGTRMKELTESTPKPIITINGRPFLEYSLESLPHTVDEVVCVVGYFAEKIRAHFGNEYKGKKISYVTQENYVGGTAQALWHAREHLHGKFLVVNGDDIYDLQALEKAVSEEWALLVFEKDAIGKAGKVIVDDQGIVVDVIEGDDHDGGAGFVNTGAYVLDERIFKHPLVPKAIGSSEFGLPQTIVAAARAEGIKIQTVPTKFWIQFTSPEDVSRAEEAFAKLFS